MNRAAHWDAAFAGGDEQRSWYQARPSESLQTIERMVSDRDVAIIDVGGGASALSGALLDSGYLDLTVLDISKTALSLAESRLGKSAERITWIAADVLAWRPTPATSSGMTGPCCTSSSRRMIAGPTRRPLHEALAPGGYAIIAGFAPAGPDRCSGLPVHRSSADDILDLSAAGLAPSRAVLRSTPSRRTGSSRLRG
ncbi:MAG TPA: class I SAM-dependent methyltransferase [Solirubrobacteraceae bacterium]|nr:class I SAM-dependent methyltransferase [Solirubrobacteraceae bacterium]